MLLHLLKKVAIPYKSGKYSYGVKMLEFGRSKTELSQSLINQGNILTGVNGEVYPCKDDILSQSLINQGNILTEIIQ